MKRESEILEELIATPAKFSVYRAANILISLKDTLKTEHIPYELVLSVLDIYHLTSPVNDEQEINEEKLGNIIHDIFFGAEKQGCFSSVPGMNTVDEASGDVTEYLLGMFYPSPIPKKTATGATGRSIRLCDLKQALLILCKVSNQEQIINEHFSLYCDHNRCVTRYRLRDMLTKISHLLKYIDSEFDVNKWNRCNVVEEWFAKCPGIAGLNEFQFTSFWVESQSIFRDYAQFLAICQRFMEKKDNDCPLKCSFCKNDVRAFRFECKFCSDFAICLHCFTVATCSIDHILCHRLRLIPFFNKCYLLFKKCSDLFGCMNGSSGCNKSDGPTTIKTDFKEIVHEEFGTNVNANSTLQKRTLSRRYSHQYECKLSAIVALLLSENEKLRTYVTELEKEGNDRNNSTQIVIRKHLETLKVIVMQLEEYAMQTTVTPTSSTPYRKMSVIRKSNSQSEFLNKSIKGPQASRSFLDQNNSNLSISDVTTWLYTKQLPSTIRDIKDNLSTVNENENTTVVDNDDMLNFRELLHIVRDIIEDSYSDNTELSKATNQLENVLDSIIDGEEKRRCKQ
ncbi:hypothetical protein Bhyg_11519 [Pseudolycoriella hygida]|uniref:ZZ-type domain-containing protein n=1 Tax=Pseudolycoriella hygida TaxID=35572 RepID=A0A9Q0MVQ0_9DIPT|nr:hypothetical protein Bhyg_11519 [Pseudolycoriella hygida]